MAEFISKKIPIDNYDVDDGSLPDDQRMVFNQLREAAQRAGWVYYLQKQSLRSVKGNLEDFAKDDPLALDPLSFPDKGRFVPLWEHSVIAPYLQEAQAAIYNASNIAQRYGEFLMARYLRIAGSELMQGSDFALWKGYMEYVGRDYPPRMDFLMWPVETEDGKRVYQSHLSIVDQDETRKIKEDTRALRQAGGKRRGGRWYTPRTEVSVVEAGVLGGFLSSVAQAERRRELGLQGEGGVNAINILNNEKATSAYGTRLIVFKDQFQQVFDREILPDSQPYLIKSLLPTMRGTLRFLVAHEVMHDERYPRRLGRLHQAVRESYANQGGIDLGSDVWDLNSKAFQLQSVIRGCLGFSFRDCIDILSSDKQMPDLETMIEMSSYIPGSLGYINAGLMRGAFKEQNGMIVGIDLYEAFKLSQELAREERKIMRRGTYQDARNHLESILPKGSILRKNNNIKIA